MSLLSKNSLIQLVDTGVITGVDPKYINGASIDITLAPTIRVESKDARTNRTIKLWKKSLGETYTRFDVSPALKDLDVTEPVVIEPGEFFLAASAEKFNLPRHIACEYKLTSTIGRCGLQHMLAGWGDPGWYGSHMTLEFVHSLRYHPVEIKAGMIIGQIIFWECEAVPEGEDYSVVGRYNNQGILPTPGLGVGKHD